MGLNNFFGYKPDATIPWIRGLPSVEKTKDLLYKVVDSHELKFIEITKPFIYY